MEGLRDDSSFRGPGAHPMPGWDTKVFTASRPRCSWSEQCPQAGEGKGELGGCTVRMQHSWFNSLSLGPPLEKKYSSKKRGALSLGFDLAFINNSKNLHGSRQLFHYCR